MESHTLLSSRWESTVTGVHPSHCGHFWGVAQGLVGGGLQAWEAGQPADWEGGGDECETAVTTSGHSVG